MRKEGKDVETHMSCLTILYTRCLEGTIQRNTRRGNDCLTLLVALPIVWERCPELIAVRGVYRTFAFYLQAILGKS